MFSNGALLIYFLVMMINIIKVSDYLLYKANVEMMIMENLMNVNESIVLEKAIIDVVEAIDYEQEYLNQHYINDHLITIELDNNEINVKIEGEFNFMMKIDMNMEEKRANWYKLIND